MQIVWRGLQLLAQNPSDSCEDILMLFYIVVNLSKLLKTYFRRIILAQWQCCSTLSVEREKEKTFKCSGVALSIKWKKQIWHQMLSRLSDTYKWICTFNLKTLFLSTYILLRGLMRSCTGPRLIFVFNIFTRSHPQLSTNPRPVNFYLTFKAFWLGHIVRG